MQQPGFQHGATDYYPNLIEIFTLNSRNSATKSQALNSDKVKYRLKHIDISIL